MLFNSVEFFIFLPIVFTIYWILNGKTRSQNFLLLVASYFFYGWWDWRFLFLIAFSSLVDYVIGNKLYATEKSSSRKFLLFASLFVNIGFLGVFKYYNFFVDTFENAFTLFGQHIEASRLNVILPVGISFYTFQTLSYTIDIYYQKLKPTTNLLSFSVFVAFFPQLVAGPIERAKHLLPQFENLRKVNWEEFKTGIQFILWGLFKKVVVADNVADYINEVYKNPTEYGSISNIVATLFFAIQIYCDFSAYSNIAIGTSKLFGFDLMQNFNVPYFSKSIKEFWSRWHISLSTWFRDYIYIPMGGNRCSNKRWIVNIMTTFTISGLWHGANWTFVIWGALHGLAYIIESYLFNEKNNSKIQIFLNHLYAIFIVLIAWIFFRANSLNNASEIITQIFTGKFSFQLIYSSYDFTICLYGIFIVMVFDWLKNKAIIVTMYRLTYLRWSFYYLIIFSIVLFGKTKGSEFIYFQF